MWRETGLPNGGVMAGTYHMNLEERSLRRRSARRAPQPRPPLGLQPRRSRSGPGQGDINFAPILQALVEIGYGGYLTFELDVHSALRSGAVRAEDDPLGRLSCGRRSSTPYCSRPGSKGSSGHEAARCACAIRPTRIAQRVPSARVQRLLDIRNQSTAPAMGR